MIYCNSRLKAPTLLPPLIVTIYNMPPLFRGRFAREFAVIRLSFPQFSRALENRGSEQIYKSSFSGSSSTEVYVCSATKKLNCMIPNELSATLNSENARVRATMNSGIDKCMSSSCAEVKVLKNCTRWP